MYCRGLSKLGFRARLFQVLRRQIREYYGGPAGGPWLLFAFHDVVTELVLLGFARHLIRKLIEMLDFIQTCIFVDVQEL